MGLRIGACVLLACVASGLAQTRDELGKMLDGNQTFALRDAVERGGGDVPVFYRGAVEASVNKMASARRHLEQAIRQEPQSKLASDAREMLGNMASRNGRYREALRWIQQAHAATPDSSDVNNVLPAFQAFAEPGDMKVVELKGSSLNCKDGLPVVINGKPVTYGFDTGGQQSVMGEADARCLGLN